MKIRDIARLIHAEGTGEAEGEIEIRGVAKIEEAAEGDITFIANGAIVGWAFSNHPMPAESRLPKILNAIRTPIPDVLQAVQWTYSPAGLPISILTGKLAADQVAKEIRKAPSGR